MKKRSNSPEVVGTGLTVLDRIYADGDLAGEELGGSCGNVLLSLAMLRRQVAPLLALGRDEIGNRLVDEFRRAGANTRYISQHLDILSPVILQELDTSSGEHTFSFTCRHTQSELPRYRPVEDAEVAFAATILQSCSVFYADRLTSSIVRAMEQAHAAGAIVYFEPSDLDDKLFDQALGFASILKYSSDRLGAEVEQRVRSSPALAIVTHGADGLELRQSGRSLWCRAVQIDQVTDACGSGDMVSVGVIDWLLDHPRRRAVLDIEDIIAGVVAGQHLAAANCAFAGARGLFHQRGAGFARAVLSRGFGEIDGL